MNEEKKIIQLDEVGPKTSKARKGKVLSGLIFILALTAGIFFWFSYSGRKDEVSLKNYTVSRVSKEQFVSATEASGTVVLPIQVEIVSPDEGYTLSLNVEEGDTVGTGDVLAELDVPDLDDKLNELTVDLKQAEIELENLENTYYYTIRQLERDLKRLDEEILEAEEDVRIRKELAELKSSRESDYEDALDILEELEEQREDAGDDLESAVKAGDIALRKQQAAINQLQVDLDIVREDIEENRIKSPIAGEVLSISDDLYIPGSLIEDTDTLFTVADRNEVYIDFDVYEQYASLLEIGGEMTVTVGTDTMKAEIIRIGKIATMDTDGLSAMITVRAEPVTDKSLTPGASAVATITLSVQDDVLVLPRGSWLTTGGQEYAYVVKDGKACKTKVVLGEIQGTDVEILSGLEAGDKVITGSYQAYIDQEVVSLK